MSTRAPARTANAGFARDHLVWRDVIALARPRVTLVAVLTGAPALAWNGAWPRPATVAGVLAGLALLGAGASALNAWVERDRDALMARTRDRPLPAGRLEPGVALGVGALAAAAGIAILGAWGSLLGGLLGAAMLAFYLGPYTLWSKPHTAWSAVVGAAPGAAAPLIADAAAHGHVGAWGWTLFAIVFLWQPPHVWSIELFRRRELDAADLPSMPARAGEQGTRRLMLAWIVVLVPLTLMPWRSGTLGTLYGVVALGLGLQFAHAAVVALRARHAAADRRAFLASLVHMTWLFAVMLIDLLIG